MYGHFENDRGSLGSKAAHWLLPALVTFLAASAGCRVRSNSSTGKDSPGSSPARQAAEAEENTPIPEVDPENLTIPGPTGLNKGLASVDKMAPPQDQGTPDGKPQPSAVERASGISLTEPQDDGFYFMIMWGYQGRGALNLPRNAHTFATFIESAGEDLRTSQLKAFTMSWLPVDGVVRLVDSPKPGRWYSLQETLQLAWQGQFNLRRTPVFQISSSLYKDALVRYRDLDARGRTGNVLYLANDDMTGRMAALRKTPGGYTNCIHAVSDAIAPSAGPLNTGTRRGWPASEAVLAYFRAAGHLPLPQTFDALLAPRLGLQ